MQTSYAAVFQSFYRFVSHDPPAHVLERVGLVLDDVGGVGSCNSISVSLYD